MYLLLWLQCDWKKWKKGVFPKFGNFSSWKVYLWAVTHSDLPLLGAGGKSHSYCQHLGISARSDFLVFLTPLMGRAGSCWARVQKAWICLLVASSLPSPALPSILQTLGFSPLLLWNRLGSCWSLWLISVYLVCPQCGGTCDLGKKKSWTCLHPTPASRCTLGRMLSELNALSIPRGTKPSQAILRFILQTSWFSWVSLSKYLITILGKSLSLWALKTMDR